MSDYAWNPVAIVPIVALVACVAIGIVIVRKNPRWIVSRVYLVSLSISVFFNLTEVVLTLTRPEAFESTGYMWGRLGWLAIPLFASAGIWFALVARRHFTGKKELHPTDALLFVPGAVIAVALATIGSLTTPQLDTFRDNVSLPLSPWGFALGFHNELLAVASLYLLWDARRRATNPAAKNQLKWFFLGFAVVIVQNTISSVLVWADISYGGFPNLSLSVALMMGLTSYGIVRYRLFDIRVRVYIRRALIVSISTALAVGLVGLTLAALSEALGPAYRENQAAISVAVLLPAILLLRQWERLSTAGVELLFPSLKWKESEVGDVFLVSNAGLMITHITGASRLRIEGGMLAGMLTAIQDFVRSTIEGEGATGGRQVGVLTYGETKVLIEHGPECYMVVVFDGFETEALRSDVRKALGAIHDQLGEAIADWDGGRWIRERVDPVIGSMLGPGPRDPHAEGA